MVQATWPCGPYNPAGLRVFQVSVAENDTVWNLWQAPVGEKKMYVLAVWSKGMPFTAEKLYVF